MKSIPAGKASALINCSNLHVGGGVAVATSFIDCLSKIPNSSINIHLLLSSAVYANLTALNVDFHNFSSCKVKDFFGFSALWNNIDAEFKTYSAVFSVFGPIYFVKKNTKHIIGFAQPLIIYPDNSITANSSLSERLVLRLKHVIQCAFFARVDSLVVELEHVERGLRNLSYFQKLPIYIVHSSVHSIFFKPTEWRSISTIRQTDQLKLGIIARNYPHKNLKILPAVKKALLQTYGMKISFYVTLVEDEWNSSDDDFKQSVFNAGPLSLSQCPTFYDCMDGVIFPSLLECFSAIPIEAMISKRPLFASNLPFIRDVCSTHCQYFDPLEPFDIARSIFEYFVTLNDMERQERLAAAYSHALSFPTAEDRAREYVQIIEDHSK